MCWGPSIPPLTHHMHCGAGHRNTRLKEQQCLCDQPELRLVESGAGLDLPSYLHGRPTALNINGKQAPQCMLRANLHYTPGGSFHHTREVTVLVPSW